MLGSSGRNEIHLIFELKSKFHHSKAQSTSFRNRLRLRKYIVGNSLPFSYNLSDLQIYLTWNGVKSENLELIHTNVLMSEFTLPPCISWCSLASKLSKILNAEVKFFHLMISFNKKVLIILALLSKETWHSPCWWARPLWYSLSSPSTKDERSARPTKTSKSKEKSFPRWRSRLHL